MAPDSVSYLSPVLTHLAGGPFYVAESRGFGYPLFLLFILKTFRRLFVVLVVQHALALVTGAVTSLLYFRHVRRSWLVTMGLFMVVSCSPRSVFYAHSLLTETLYTSLQMLSLWLIFEAASRFRSAAVLAGFIATGAILTRPLGKALVLMMTGILPLIWKRFRLRRALLTTLTVTLIASSACLVTNRLTRGFWGFERIGRFYVFGNAMRYLDPKTITPPELRSLLAPYYTEAHRDNMKNMNWVWHSPDGPVQRLASEPRFADEREKIYLRLTVQALAQSPVKIFLDHIRLGFEFIWRGASMPPSEQLQKDRLALESLQEFEEITLLYPDLRSLSHFRPQEATSYFERIRNHTLFPFEPGPWYQWPAWALRGLFPILPVLGLISVPLLCRSRRGRRLCSLVLPVIGIQLLMIVAGGYYTYRYSYPFEPLYALLVAGAIGVICDEISGRSRGFQARAH